MFANSDKFLEIWIVIEELQKLFSNMGNHDGWSMMMLIDLIMKRKMIIGSQLVL